jgi:predicted O-methyltransferase YrrM
MSLVADPAAPLSVARIRRQVYEANAQGRADEARALLENALKGQAQPDPELAADLAAMALRDGDLVQAIQGARQVLRQLPKHDSAQFTLGFALSAIGSNAEALVLLQALTRGERGSRFQGVLPELAALAVGEVARLKSMLPRGTQFGSASHPGPSGSAATHGTVDGNGKYDFSHLVQPPEQDVGGPIQDDEALALYALVRTMRIRRVLEIGGLSGYSARNFLAALSWDTETAVYTVDLDPVASQAANHFTIRKDVGLLEPRDLHDKPLDLVFFDAHVYDAQMEMFLRLRRFGLITDATVIALHDTGLHPRRSAPWSYPVADSDGQHGWVHQDVERRMVNSLRRDFGYDAICLHTPLNRNDERLPFRHGVTVMKKYAEMKT